MILSKPPIFLTKFNNKYEVYCHGNICASAPPTSFKIVSSAGASYYFGIWKGTTLAYGRTRACCACSRCETGGLFFVFFFFISSILSSFSNASSVGRLLDILKYCGLGRYNPAVVILLPEVCSLSTGLPLSRSKPAQEQC